MVRKAFLPGDYSPPSNDRFFKLSTGENRIRILSEVVTGFVSWIDKDGKRTPVRDHDAEAVNVNPEKPPKFFWSMVIWNYQAVKNPDGSYSGKVQLWEMTQTTIRETLEGLLEDPDWGDVRDYDISVSKKGEGMDTKYQAVPKPKKDLDPAIQDAYNQSEMRPDEVFGTTKAVPAAPDPTPKKGDNTDISVEDVPF